jgi:hypothetical protein
VHVALERLARVLPLLLLLVDLASLDCLLVPAAGAPSNPMSKLI